MAIVSFQDGFVYICIFCVCVQLDFAPGFPTDVRPLPLLSGVVGDLVLMVRSLRKDAES